MNKTIRIGSRGSALALWQANKVQSILTEKGLKSEIIIIKTKGDNIQHLSFDKIEGKGFFTKEIEEALYSDSVDLAIHSCKDLETENPKGLTIAAIFNRTEVRDTIVFKKESWAQLLEGKLEKLHLGTSSARRKSQLLRIYPGTTFKDIRGNVPTRLEKLAADKELDGIVLAKAGYSRLGLDMSAFYCHTPDVVDFVPAAAQGALAIQCREADSELRAMLETINETDSSEGVLAERKLLAMFGGGCQKPTAIHVQAISKTDYKVLISHADSGELSGAYFEFVLANLNDDSLKTVVDGVKKKMYS
jgi:hydroxymethylbilane synthase